MNSNSSNDFPLSDAQAWAATRLGLDAASSSKAILQLLHRLGTWEFLPDPLAHQAMRTLLATDPSAASEFSFGARINGTYEDFLREQIENFIVDFYRLPCDARGDRWDRLRERVWGFPALLARLDALRPGLNIDPRIGDEAPAGVLALRDQLMEIVLLRPAERAESWHDFLNTIAQDSQAASRAARWLVKERPDLAGLAPERVGDLLNWKYHGRYRKLKKFFRGSRPKTEGKPVNYKYVVTMIVAITVLRVLASLLGDSRQSRNNIDLNFPRPRIQDRVPRHQEPIPDHPAKNFFTP